MVELNSLNIQHKFTLTTFVSCAVRLSLVLRHSGTSTSVILAPDSVAISIASSYVWAGVNSGKSSQGPGSLSTFSKWQNLILDPTSTRYVTGLFCCTIIPNSHLALPHLLCTNTFPPSKMYSGVSCHHRQFGFAGISPA